MSEGVGCSLPINLPTKELKIEAPALLGSLKIEIVAKFLALQL